MKFHSKLPTLYFMAFTCSAFSALAYDTATYPSQGSVYEQSKAFLGKGDARASREWKATKKSLPTLAVSVRDHYIMKKHTFLTAMSLIINYTVNLLVSF